jgi:hypothetical protein
LTWEGSAKEKLSLQICVQKSACYNGQHDGMECIISGIFLYWDVGVSSLYFSVVIILFTAEQGLAVSAVVW